MWRFFIFVSIMSGIIFGSFVFAQDGAVQFQPVISLDGVFDGIRQAFTDVMKNGYALFLSLFSVWLAYRVFKMLLNDKADKIDISASAEETIEDSIDNESYSKGSYSQENSGY
jgi:hypothetical protein